MKKISSTNTSKIDFDLRQLEVFRKVVDLGSFSKAAKAVFLAQASVSERIATLETLVGTKLLDRLSRKIVPTRAGELLYKHAVLLLDMKETACLEMQDFLGMKGGEILMGGSTIPGEYVLPKALGFFREKYPNISVILKIADTVEIERMVLNGDIELGVIGSKSSNKTVVHYKLWEDELVVVVPKGHRWSKQKKISLEEIYGEPFILRELGSGTLKIMEEYICDSKKDEMEFINVVARLGTSTAIKEGIKSGLGISILSFRALETELENGLIEVLRLKDKPMSRNFYLIRDSRRIASPICSEMIQFLIEISKDDSLGRSPWAK